LSAIFSRHNFQALEDNIEGGNFEGSELRLKILSMETVVRKMMRGGDF